MGEFSIFHLAFLVFIFLPFIAWAIKPQKVSFVYILGHIVRWYGIGLAGLMIFLTIGLGISSLFETKESNKIEIPISQPIHQIQPQKKGIELI